MDGVRVRIHSIACLSLNVSLVSWALISLSLSYSLGLYRSWTFVLSILSFSAPVILPLCHTYIPSVRRSSVLWSVRPVAASVVHSMCSLYRVVSSTRLFLAFVHSVSCFHASRVFLEVLSLVLDCSVSRSCLLLARVSVHLYSLSLPPPLPVYRSPSLALSLSHPISISPSRSWSRYRLCLCLCLGLSPFPVNSKRARELAYCNSVSPVSCH